MPVHRFTTSKEHWCLLTHPHDHCKALQKVLWISRFERTLMSQYHTQPLHSQICLLQMWRFEGSQTLWSYMRRTSLFRDECLVTLASDLAMPEPLAVATVMRQLCENLAVSSP